MDLVGSMDWKKRGTGSGAGEAPSGGSSKSDPRSTVHPSTSAVPTIQRAI